jgi:hypothetical protein
MHEATSHGSVGGTSIPTEGITFIGYYNRSEAGTVDSQMFFGAYLGNSFPVHVADNIFAMYGQSMENCYLLRSGNWN